MGVSVGAWGPQPKWRSEDSFEVILSFNLDFEARSLLSALCCVLQVASHVYTFSSMLGLQTSTSLRRAIKVGTVSLCAQMDRIPPRLVISLQEKKKKSDPRKSSDT